MGTNGDLREVDSATLEQFLDGFVVGHGENFAGKATHKAELPEVEEMVEDSRG